MKSIEMLSFLLSAVFLLMVLYLIRKRYLKEQYSLLWFAFGALLLLLSGSEHWLNLVSTWMHVFYAPALLFLIGILFSFALILHLTVIVSRMSEQMIRLTQELGMLKSEVNHRSGEEEA